MGAFGFIFAGQGAQYAGMGARIAQANAAAAAVFQEADAVLGYSLSDLCFKGTLEELTPCAVCQPAIYTVSLACLAAYRQEHPEVTPVACGGLSLGEYAAACVAGVFDFATGLRLVAERGRLMDRCCQDFPGGMAAVIGADPAELESACQAGGIDVANYNCPGQVVISGEKEKLAKVVEALTPKAKRVIPLTVAGAYHSRLMTSAAEAFGASLDAAEIRPPHCTFVQNVTGGPVSAPDEIRHNLKLQIASSVRWEACARAMLKECSQFLEFGPGNVLSGFFKRIERTVPAEPAIQEP